jgi:hypothetical protein
MPHAPPPVPAGAPHHAGSPPSPRAAGPRRATARDGPPHAGPTASARRGPRGRPGAWRASAATAQRTAPPASGAPGPGGAPAAARPPRAPAAVAERRAPRRPPPAGRARARGRQRRRTPPGGRSGAGHPAGPAPETCPRRPRGARAPCSARSTSSASGRRGGAGGGATAAAGAPPAPPPARAPRPAAARPASSPARPPSLPVRGRAPRCGWPARAPPASTPPVTPPGPGGGRPSVCLQGGQAARIPGWAPRDGAAASTAHRVSRTACHRRGRSTGPWARPNGWRAWGSVPMPWAGSPARSRARGRAHQRSVWRDAPGGQARCRQAWSQPRETGPSGQAWRGPPRAAARHGLRACAARRTWAGQARRCLEAGKASGQIVWSVTRASGASARGAADDHRGVCYRITRTIPATSG